MEYAKRDGDNDAAQFFKQAQEQNQQWVRRGKELLNQRL
jgi:hypothetical protein